MPSKFNQTEDRAMSRTVHYAFYQLYNELGERAEKECIWLLKNKHGIYTESTHIPRGHTLKIDAFLLITEQELKAKIEEVALTQPDIAQAIAQDEPLLLIVCSQEEEQSEVTYEFFPGDWVGQNRKKFLQERGWQ